MYQLAKVAAMEAVLTVKDHYSKLQRHPHHWREPGNNAWRSEWTNKDFWAQSNKKIQGAEAQTRNLGVILKYFISISQKAIVFAVHMPFKSVLVICKNISLKYEENQLFLPLQMKQMTLHILYISIRTHAHIQYLNPHLKAGISQPAVLPLTVQTPVNWHCLVYFYSV